MEIAEKMNGADRTKNGPPNGEQQPALQTTVHHSSRLGRRTIRGEDLEQRGEAKP